MCDILKMLSLQKFCFWLTSQPFFISTLVVFRISHYIIPTYVQRITEWAGVELFYLGNAWFGSWK